MRQAANEHRDDEGELRHARRRPGIQGGIRPLHSGHRDDGERTRRERQIRAGGQRESGDCANWRLRWLFESATIQRIRRREVAARHTGCTALSMR